MTTHLVPECVRVDHEAPGMSQLHQLTPGAASRRAHTRDQPSRARLIRRHQCTGCPLRPPTLCCGSQWRHHALTGTHSPPQISGCRTHSKSAMKHADGKESSSPQLSCTDPNIKHPARGPKPAIGQCILDVGMHKMILDKHNASTPFLVLCHIQKRQSHPTRHC
jgi:hypothetical protein